MSLASSSSSLASAANSVLLHTRTRPLPLRKTHLFQHHSDLITSSPLLLFLRPGDFSATEWRELRGKLSALNAPSSPTSNENHLKLTVLRPGLLPALLRSPSLSNLDLSLLSSTSHTKGPLAILTASQLDPPTLTKILALLSKASLSISRNAAPVDPKAKGKVVAVERLELLSSLVEKRAFEGKEGIKTIASLPTLDVLRSQIVGILSAPAARIVGVVGARGRELGRTLEGLKEGLRIEQEGPVVVEAGAEKVV